MLPKWVTDKHKSGKDSKKKVKKPSLVKRVLKAKKPTV